MLIVVDDSLQTPPTWWAEPMRQVITYSIPIFRRDYSADIVTDLAAADEGEACPECGQPLRVSRGVEVGNIFKLGTRYSDSLGSTFLDQDGQSNRSSWVPTVSAAAGCWPAWPRPTTMQTACSGR